MRSVKKQKIGSRTSSSPIKRNTIPINTIKDEEFEDYEQFCEDTQLDTLLGLKTFIDEYKYTKSQFRFFMENLMKEPQDIRDKKIAIGRLAMNGHLVDEYFKSKDKNVIIPLPSVYPKQDNYILDRVIGNYMANVYYGENYCDGFETTLRYLRPQLNFIYRLRSMWRSVLAKYTNGINHMSEEDTKNLLYLFEKIPPLEYPIVVYRGTYSEVSNFNNGKFISTTLCSATTNKFTGRGGAIYQITLSAGSKILPIFNLKSFITEEVEILLAPDTTNSLKIVGELEYNLPYMRNAPYKLYDVRN